MAGRRTLRHLESASGGRNQRGRALEAEVKMLEFQRAQLCGPL